MSLTDEDVQTLGRLLDERLAATVDKSLDKKLDEKFSAMRAAERSRRRFWMWFWIAVFVFSSVLSWWGAKVVWERIQGELTAQDQALVEMKMEYQKQLAANKQMQEERAEAAKMANYRSDQTQAQYEAGLVGGLFKTLGQVNKLKDKWKDADLGDLDQLEAFAADYSSMTEGALGLVTQMLLRNTDPALNSSSEDLMVHGESTSPATSAGLKPAP